MKPQKSTRGGRREGAGRKSLDGAVNMRRVNVMLDEPTIARAIRIGAGNLSLGIRKAVHKSR
jgi:hypothetical protein